MKMAYKKEWVVTLGVAIVAFMCLVADSNASGRWIAHVITAQPGAGVMGKPIDSVVAPETTGHWVWVLWYDMNAGIWTYNAQTPFFYSANGTVDFQVPEYGGWYYLLLYDTVTGIYY